MNVKTIPLKEKSSPVPTRLERERFNYLDNAMIRSLVGMPEAIGLMETAFGLLSGNECFVPQRVVMNAPGADLAIFFKPAFIERYKRLSIKLLTQSASTKPSGLPTIMGMVILISTESGQVLCACDAGYLTALRTGAASGIASAKLARRDASTAAIFGCGAQGRTQLEALLAVRPIKKVYIFDRNHESACLFANEFAGRLEVIHAENTDVLINADIISTSTPETSPLFSLSDVKPGTHINAIGSYTPAMQELDPFLIRESVLFVDSRASCLIESGDLVKPISQGLFGEDIIRGEIGDLINKKVIGRTSDDQITIFKSVGNAIQDFFIINEAFDRSMVLA